MPYDSHDITVCLEKVTAVQYNEQVSVGSVSVTAVCSGFSIGSCNWVVQNAAQKVSYLSACSAFRRHPSGVSPDPLRNSSVVLLSSQSSQPTYRLSFEQVLNKLGGHLEETVTQGGKVIIPVLSSGVVYDLIEFIFSFLRRKGLGRIRVFFISSIAKQSLSYATVTGEWLTQHKQDQVLRAENPFAFEQLIKEGLLYPLHSETDDIYKSANTSGETRQSEKKPPTTIFEWNQPCIVLCSHPSLRFGPAVKILQRYNA